MLDGNEALAVEATVDPFEQRSFSGPDESDTHGHSIGRVESAIITIKVPKATLSNAKLDNLAVRFYRIKPEVDLQQINVAALQQLKQADQVEDVINIEAGKLANLVITDGDILEFRTKVKQMFIAGRPVDMMNKHQRLYEKFKDRP